MILLEDSADLITSSVDSVLSQLDFIDKFAFYEVLEGYGVSPKEIGRNFEKFHEVIKQEFGIRHFTIERSIIQELHKKDKPFSRVAEISAFSLVTSIFAAEIAENIARHKELADSRAYTKTLEQKVKVYDDKLKSTERLAAIGQTAAMVGHDIRNPLQAIAGDLYLIENDIACIQEGDIKKSLQESASGIEANLFYINKIVSDLQDFARPLVPSREEFTVEKLLESVFLLVPIPDNLEVIIDVQPNFLYVITDFMMLKRALVNLVQNAVQAMPKGGKLTFEAAASAECYSFKVTDSGEGMPESVRVNLFKPMFTTKAKGQGLGLAVAKRLVEALKGTITYESELGKGTKFLIKLPRNW